MNRPDDFIDGGAATIVGAADSRRESRIPAWASHVTVSANINVPD